ncbi:MAG: site-specific integrase [Myxococcales bacterium]|nr:MAG: site-specific integrase [Myxococcales bacterium]
MPRPSRSGIRGLYFDADGRARIDLRYTDVKGTEQRYKEVFPLGTPKAAARVKAQAVLGAAVAGTLKPRSDAPATVRLAQAFGTYLSWIETNRPKAHKQRKSITKLWIETVGDVPIERLNGALLESYKSKRLAAGETAPATINKGLMVVKHMAGLAVRAGWGFLDRERAAEIREVPKLQEPPGRQRPIKASELQALLAAFTRVDSRFARRVVQAALLTGCRLGEILALEAGDVRGKVIDLSKTKQNRNHQIVITPPLAAVLKEALADEKRGKAAAVFVNRTGKAYTVDGFSKHFARVAERAGVPDITFHDLRRHVGTLLINEGERLEVVSKLLGHSTVAVTQRSYAHLATDATRAAFGKLAEFAPVLPPAATKQTPKRRQTG